MGLLLVGPDELHKYMIALGRTIASQHYHHVRHSIREPAVVLDELLNRGLDGIVIASHMQLPVFSEARDPKEYHAKFLEFLLAARERSLRVAATLRSGYHLPSENSGIVGCVVESFRANGNKIDVIEQADGLRDFLYPPPTA